MKNLLFSCALLFLAGRASSQSSMKVVATKDLHFEIICPNAVTYASVITAGDTILLKFPTGAGTAILTDVKAAAQYKNMGTGDSGNSFKIPQENMADAIHVVSKGVLRRFVRGKEYGWY